MTLSDQERNQLINYRIKQAKDTIEVVDFLIENNQLQTAVNRIYYGIFYSVLALSLSEKFETSKHNQLIGWFNREFIKTGRIDKKYGKTFKSAYEYRTTGDYDTFVEFEKDEVNLLFDEMKDFINKIDLFIQRK